MILSRTMRAPLAGFALLALIGTATAQMPTDVKVANGMLTNSAGMTLYTFDKDAAGKSACNGPCAANWPPVAAPANAKDSGDWTAISREDGSKQWAYKGKPVYAWSKDQKPGDMTGDGFLNNAWHVAKP